MVNECAGERYAKDVKQSAKKDHHEEDGFETANCRMDHHPQLAEKSQHANHSQDTDDSHYA